MSVALDPNLALPPGLAHGDAEREAIRFATLEIIDRARREPLRLSNSIPRSMGLTYRGGVDYRGRPTHVWGFRVASLPGLSDAQYHLLGVQASRQSYYAVYQILEETDEEAENQNLAGWIAGDWRAYSARERILDVYRRRQYEEPHNAGRHYELALVGVTLGTYFLTVSRVDAFLYPGGLDEFVPVARAALQKEPDRPKYLALTAFLYERLTRFDQAARLYGEAAAADRRSAVYAFLHADALLFAGDASGAARAAREAERRAQGRSRRSRYEFGLHRKSLLESFKHSLYEEAWALRKKIEGLKETGKSDRARAEEYRRAITIDRTKVPRSFHDLIRLAKKWGVGDDPSRSHLTDRATAKDKAALKKALPLKRRGEIQAWLDSLGPRGITGHEAGAFMYLLEALDEMRL
jgi:tetratricopeptide (TPR) repeat protein